MRVERSATIVLRIAIETTLVQNNAHHTLHIMSMQVNHTLMSTAMVVLLCRVWPWVRINRLLLGGSWKRF